MQVIHVKEADIKYAINLIDLSSVVKRLVFVNGWEKEQALSVMQQYKNFLFLKYKYGQQYSVPPSIEIDEFWHSHILYTKKYNQDCLLIFGGYLHHYPFDFDKKILNKAEYEEKFENETQRFYFAEFGEYIYSIQPVLTRKMFHHLFNFIKRKLPVKNWIRNIFKKKQKASCAICL